MITVHSLPFLAILINVLISRVNFIPSHGIYYMIEGALYSVTNFFGCLYRKHVLYPFLPWTDYKSVLVCIMLDIFCGVLY